MPTVELDVLSLWEETMEDDTLYRSYLIRLWRRGAERAPAWTVALEDVRTGERRGFASLEEALSFLGAQLGEVETFPEPGEPS
jgi:hypothetical protein